MKNRANTIKPRHDTSFARKIRSPLFFCLFIILLSFPSICSGLEISFLSQKTINKASIQLVDIASFSEENALTKVLKSQYIRQSPDPGSEIFLSARAIILELSKALSLSDDIYWTGAESIGITRKGIEISSDKIMADIAQYISSRQDKLSRADYQFIPRSLPFPFMIPEGKLEITVLPSKKQIIGSKRFTLIYKVDGEVIRNFSILGHLRAMTEVAVAVSNIRRDSIITPALVEMELRDLSLLRNPGLDLGQLLGRKLKRSIQAGSVIDLTHVEFPPMIKKGDFVKIIIDARGLQLTATGVARTNGKQNDIIRVKNINSRKDIFCRVAAPGLVEVKI